MPLGGHPPVTAPYPQNLHYGAPDGPPVLSWRERIVGDLFAGVGALLSPNVGPESECHPHVGAERRRQMWVWSRLVRRRPRLDQVIHVEFERLDGLELLGMALAHLTMPSLGAMSPLGFRC